MGQCVLGYICIMYIYLYICIGAYDCVPLSSQLRHWMLGHIHILYIYLYIYKGAYNCVPLSGGVRP